MQLIKSEIFKGNCLERLRELVLSLKAENPALSQSKVVDLGFKTAEETLEVLLLFQS